MILYCQIFLKLPLKSVLMTTTMTTVSCPVSNVHPTLVILAHKYTIIFFCNQLIQIGCISTVRVLVYCLAGCALSSEFEILATGPNNPIPPSSSSSPPHLFFLFLLFLSSSHTIPYHTIKKLAHQAYLFFL